MENIINAHLLSISDSILKWIGRLKKKCVTVE